MACAPKRKIPATIEMSLLIVDPRITEGPIVGSVGSSAQRHPSSKVVTPNTRSRRTGRIAPVYIRAVSNTGARPWSRASATASLLVLGTSIRTSPAPPAASSAAKVASAAARSSATSGPILRPLRHGRGPPPRARGARRHGRAGQMARPGRTRAGGRGGGGAETPGAPPPWGRATAPPGGAPPPAGGAGPAATVPP